MVNKTSFNYGLRYANIEYEGDSILNSYMSKQCRENIVKTSRPSPQYHANKCPYIVLRKNKKLYISAPDKNKVFKWKLFKTAHKCKS